MSIYELLNKLREQKGAMLGRKSAEVLSAFLVGYALARKESGCPKDEGFLDAFNGWVARRFKNEEGQGWAKLVAFHSSSDLEEWNLFWNLLDEYQERRSRKRPPMAEASH
jgi:hypothetical protein